MSDRVVDPHSRTLGEFKESEVVLTPAEQALLRALDELGVPYLVVGMAAALLQGAPGTTQDLDVWFGQIDPARLMQAARRAGGFYSPGYGMQPPTVGGEGLGRVDLVLTASGLDSFEEEYGQAQQYEIDDVRLTVLPLERVIASKEAAGRPKDQAHMPQLKGALAALRLARSRGSGPER